MRTLQLSIATLHECIMDALTFQSKTSRTQGSCRTLELSLAALKSLQGTLDNHFSRVITVSRIWGCFLSKTFFYPNKNARSIIKENDTAEGK